ncbi:MAG: Bipolar DNA helicase HerA [uncultured Thiotrichaceae bacterium]|uniref:Bipolar DNA helicase HerA n=1 Tax=uncultured Thiotrichaceae bacterium TaxID=298394 RepID=A0A6S6TD36_9GAMM|nr:MAG: Bipolar DNA helicase HerA [uncultured Thiotrichaceae bacterium]
MRKYKNKKINKNKNINTSLIDTLKNKDIFRENIEKNIGSLYSANDILNREFSLFHIEELTFEEDSPRKEAFENVLGALRIEGVNFVYLLLGNKQGVSFYFGIVKDKHYTKDLELDVDDIGKVILKSNIEGNFRGSKITEIVGDDKQTIRDTLDSMQSFARVDGVPSVNEDSENFQGVDRLVDVMLGDEFALMVLADPLSLEEIHDIERSLDDIYNELSPLAKMNLQETHGKTKTSGSSIGKSSSDTTGESTSYSHADALGSSKGTSKSNSKQGSSTGSSDSSTEGSSQNKTETQGSGTSNSKTTGESVNETKSDTENTGASKSREYADKSVNEWMKYIDEVLSARLDYGRSKGIFHSGIYLFAKNKGNLLKLGNTVCSLFSGISDNKAPLKLSYVSNDREIASVKHFQLPVSGISASQNEKNARLLFSKYGNKVASWFSTNELSVIAGLPQKEVVGLPLREEVEFGLNVKQHTIHAENLLPLGNLVRSGSQLDIAIDLDKSHLNKHTFITGVTGSGKTTTCHRLLDSADMPFMVIEPAKTEYRILTQLHDDLIIFTLGDDTVAPFRLNPFEFFPHENITSRVDMIKANIEAAFDMEAAIPQLIEAALYECYKLCGWDIATSTNTKYDKPFEDGVYAFPTLSDLLEQVPKIVEQQGFDDRLKNDYIGSIKARLQGLLIGSKGLMINTPRSIDFKNLIEMKVILELEEIKNGGEKSLIMGFVLINLNEAIKAQYESYKNAGKTFKHITLIEEAHRLLSKYMPGDNPNKKLGVETFADMLAEVRKYGESLIIVDQIPNKLTPEVLKNTNTKIVHKLFAQDDKEAIGNTMALDDEQKKFLSNLEVGRAIVSSQNLEKPLQVQVMQLERMSTTESAIIDKAQIRTLCLSFYQKHYKKGLIKGLEHYSNQPSLAQIEEYLGSTMNGLAREWLQLCSDPANASHDTFRSVKNYLIKNELNDRQNFVADYLASMLYQEHDLSRKERQAFLKSFINDVLNEKNSFTRDDKAMLRIKV